MIAQDWICPVCGQIMRLKDDYLSCDELHGTLHPLSMHTLPMALRQDYKRFNLYLPDGTAYGGFWEYVPHAHKNALTRMPGPEVVVAKVLFAQAGWQVRCFRQSNQPRKPRSRCIQ